MVAVGHHRWLIIGLVVGLVLAYAPSPVGAAPSWLDEIVQLTMHHQELVRVHGRDWAYEPFLRQLEIARTALRAGDALATYKAMNRFMDMLEADARKGDGIPTWSARFLFDYCGHVTPPLYHDASRHIHSS